MDVFLLVGNAEEEALEVLHWGDVFAIFEFDVFGEASDGIDYFVVGVELDAVLAVIAEADSGANVPTTGIDRFDALEHFDESGLTDAIWANDAHLLVACECVGKLVEDYFGAKGFRHVDCFENLRADVG